MTCEMTWGKILHKRPILSTLGDKIRVLLLLNFENIELKLTKHVVLGSLGVNQSPGCSDCGQKQVN